MEVTNGDDSNRLSGGLRCSAAMNRATPLCIEVNDVDAREAIEAWGLR
jgi:hypothetical protein